MKKLIATFSASVLMMGCATGVSKETPTELRSSPGSTSSFETTMQYDQAYRKTLEQMKSCYERRLSLLGTLTANVFGDKSPNEAQVSWGISSAFSKQKIYLTVLLEPITTGTRATLFWFDPKTPTSLNGALREWLVGNGTGCPGDNGFADKLEKLQ
jgi:hypothetical protein